MERWRLKPHTLWLTVLVGCFLYHQRGAPLSVSCVGAGLGPGNFQVPTFTLPRKIYDIARSTGHHVVPSDNSTHRCNDHRAFMRLFQQLLDSYITMLVGATTFCLMRVCGTLVTFMSQDSLKFAGLAFSCGLAGYPMQASSALLRDVLSSVGLSGRTGCHDFLFDACAAHFQFSHIQFQLKLTAGWRLLTACQRIACSLHQ